MLTFQQIIQRLTDFWEQQGCVVHQGHDVEVGAGTFNPATFLRCLGPEPYCTAYVEPSRRPSDGRYGENPNRLQLFHQFQVIMKPSPAHIQQLYLESLEALGLNLSQHDIRFVHDDWESPTVGAWGLGWEVWCDGMEITQFTYFQAMGSLSLKPISAEITYGLERLAMFIQNKDNIYDVQWNDKLTYGDICHTNEVEWSRYNFETASISLWKQHFEDFEKEARTLIEAGLPLPAYDFVIKASHAFNMLGARGAISVTERTGYISRIRDLARLIATAYVTSREQQGFPLLKKEKLASTKTPLLPKHPTSFNPLKKKDFLLEIGSEQLPATFVPIGMTQLEKGMRAWLTAHRLPFDQLQVFGSPQRLAILITGLPEGTQQEATERRGPALATAFDAHGEPTPQGLGFFKSIKECDYTLAQIRQGASPRLTVTTIKGVEYLLATIHTPSASTFDLLAKDLPGLIERIEFPKTMHWESSGMTYARPLKWLLALFAERVVPFTLAGLTSSRYSRGHAQRAPHTFSIRSPKSYLETLKKHFVLADVQERKKAILAQLRRLEKKTKSHALAETEVLAQVLHLVEWPSLLLGTFDEKFLQVPQEVLICEMVEHQKYFPLAQPNGVLTNAFIITADNAPSPLIRKGNQRVLSARLADGAFLYDQDLKQPLEAGNEKLKVMTYLKPLGSMWDKVLRLQLIALQVAETLHHPHLPWVERAALLAKADLASLLVGEFPELQGTIGKYYAQAQREPREVAEAIEEQWMPRFEGAPLPSSQTGLVLSLADKIDNLISCYRVGLKPSSSSDPHALRRQVIGLVRMLIQHKHSVNIEALLLRACTECGVTQESRAALVSDILGFITARSMSVFEELGFRKDEIEAVLQGGCTNPFEHYCKIEALHHFRKSNQAFSQLVEVYKRARGQAEAHDPCTLNRSLAQEPSEKALVAALDAVSATCKEATARADFASALSAIASLSQPLANFFGAVKVLCDETAVRHNRIALLQQVLLLFRSVIDLGKIQDGG